MNVLEMKTTTLPAAERRAHPRSVSVFRLVRISCGHDEGFARARNISDTGMKLEAAMALELDDRIDIAFSERIAIQARVIWTNGRECGVAFDQPVDSGALLALSSDQCRSPAARALRLRRSVPATIAVDGRISRTQADDMSLRELRVIHDGSFHPGMRVRVILSEGREADAVVRWTRDDVAGLHLVQPFSIDALGSVSAI